MKIKIIVAKSSKFPTLNQVVEVGDIEAAHLIRGGIAEEVTEEQQPETETE